MERSGDGVMVLQVPQQQLDYNAPLISVRRHYGLKLDVESGSIASSARSSSAAGSEFAPARVDFEDTDSVRSPGAVPFFWERAPGVSKAKQTESSPSIRHLPPPPSPVVAAGGRGGGGGGRGGGVAAVVAPVAKVAAPVLAHARDDEEEEEGREEEEDEDEEELEERNLVNAVEEERNAKARAPAPALGAGEGGRVKNAGHRNASRGKMAVNRGTGQDVASLRAFEERVTKRSFFGEIALSAISEPSDRAGSPARDRAAERRANLCKQSFSSNIFSSDSSINSSPRGANAGVAVAARVRVAGGPAVSPWEDNDVFSDAAETFAQSSYPVSVMTGVTEGGRPSVTETDPSSRDFILQRFLPAAKAMTSETKEHGERSAAQESDSADRRPLGLHSRRPSALSSARPVSRFVAVRKLEVEEEEDDEERDHVSNLAAKIGCGILPRGVARVFGQSNPCFQFKPKIRGQQPRSFVVSSPRGVYQYEQDAQFEDVRSEFWSGDDESVDRRLMEVVETQDQFKMVGKSPHTSAPRFISNVQEQFIQADASLARSAPSHFVMTSHFYEEGPEVEDEGLGGKRSGSADFDDLSPDPHVGIPEATFVGKAGTPTHRIGSPSLSSPLHEGKGFLGVPINSRTSDPDLVPIRSGRRKHTGQQEGSSTSEIVPDSLQGRAKLEDFLAFERWNKPEPRNVNIWPGVPRVATPSSSASSPPRHSNAESKHGDGIQSLLLDRSEGAESNRSSDNSSICDSDAQSISDTKLVQRESTSSQTSSGRSVSTDLDESASVVSAGKGWPLGTRQRKEKGSPKSVLHMVPPLPPSPAESWLWANLPASPMNALKPVPQLVLPKKQNDRAEADFRWQLMVRSGNTSTSSDRHRFSEELRTTDFAILPTTMA